MRKKRNRSSRQRKEERQERREEWKARLAERTMMPGDIVSGSCCLTAMGQNEIVIENYRGILEYAPERLIVLTKKCRVEICGKRLEIAYYAKEEMKITGKIECISYKKQ